MVSDLAYRQLRLLYLYWRRVPARRVISASSSSSSSDSESSEVALPSLSISLSTSSLPARLFSIDALLLRRLLQRRRVPRRLLVLLSRPRALLIRAMAIPRIPAPTTSRSSSTSSAVPNRRRSTPIELCGRTVGECGGAGGGNEGEGEGGGGGEMWQPSAGSLLIERVSLRQCR